VNVFEKQIELYLEQLVDHLERQLHAAKDALKRFRDHHHHHRPRLSDIRIGFESNPPPPPEDPMITPDTVTLTTAGQKVTARIIKFLDQDGNLMPTDFVPPEVDFSTDDTSGAVAQIVDNADNTASVTDVADGTATLTAKTTSAEGKAISATATIVVSNGPPPPPKQVLTSMQIGFDDGVAST
jgi:hypothetical protein